MFSRSPLGNGRRIAAGSILALLATVAATVVAVAVPSGAAAAAETEYTSNFTASCVLGPGILNLPSQFTVSTTAKGPSSVESGRELTFREASTTLTGPVELTEAFVSLEDARIAGTLTQFPAIVTNGSPAELNLAKPAVFPGGLPFEAPVEAGRPLTIRVPSGAQTVSWGPLIASGKYGQNLTLTASTASGFEEVESGVYRGTGAGIILAVNGYTAEGTKTIGPLKLVCNAPEHVTFASVPVTEQFPPTQSVTTQSTRTITCTTTTHTPFAPGSTEPHEGPASGGTPVTIRLETPGPTAVEFGTTQVPFEERGGAISAISPPGTGTVHVWVNTACYGRAPVGNFTYISSITAHGPEVTGVAPDEAPESGGTTVTISGHNFIGTERVLFGKQPATSFKVNSASSITAVVPPGSGKVIVRAVGYGVSEEQEVPFYYVKVLNSPYRTWALSGSLTPKLLGQPIALPSGSTFTGYGELNTETGSGSISGNIYVPPFKAAVKLFGLIPVSLGMTAAQPESITGTFARSATVSGDETLTLPVQLKLGFTSLGLLGLNLPTSCSTTQPVALTLTDTLSDTLTDEALLSKGWSGSATTAIPKISCSGGLLGALYGEVINGLIAGAGSSYSLTVAAPGG